MQQFSRSGGVQELLFYLLTSIYAYLF